ncbi:hypothetical protein CG709_02895 [Lachnotalea glycerini]|nr:hypothetical protein CG709_02895 [Lachnotalea glycerini]
MPCRCVCSFCINTRNEATVPEEAQKEVSATIAKIDAFEACEQVKAVPETISKIEFSELKMNGIFRN